MLTLKHSTSHKILTKINLLGRMEIRESVDSRCIQEVQLEVIKLIKMGETNLKPSQNHQIHLTSHLKSYKPS